VQGERYGKKKKSNYVLLNKDMPEYGLLKGHKGEIVKDYGDGSVKVVFPFASREDMVAILLLSEVSAP
jgi:hypothetical protein